MILIVDDKPENLIALKRILHKHHFEVDSALSGEEALKKVLKSNYDLILLDVQMPGLDGFEVAESIAGYNKTKDIPIIFLSAVNVKKQFINKGYASGGRDYIIKPFEPDVLILKIKMFIKLYEQTVALQNMQQVLVEEIEFRKQAERTKDEFITMASHELKTPLTSIKGYMQMVERSFVREAKEDARKYLDRTRQQLEKLNILIDDLLDTSKIASGKLDFRNKVYDFDPIIDNAVDIISQTYPSHSILKTGSADVKIYGDQLRLEQVILNYLSNAIKYSPNSFEILFDVSLLSCDEVMVNITDSGIGIPKDKQAELFTRFYRVDESSNRFQGLGMGLYVCAEIIKRHHGRYGVDSEPGKGSSFYFTLPVYQEQSTNN
ncbi:MAG: hybrid sensor histidine kinase/response regulator [Sphingobacteriaceae bacterium]|nr:MAG: hybrid sensor histidine kinase/response regulator [Sphingobacteriaceae bacterium]